MNYNTKKYVILNYACSWGIFFVPLVLVFGFGMKSLLESSIFRTLLTIIYCWMPNIVLLIFWKKLNVPMPRKEFYKQELSIKIKWSIIFRILLLEVGVCVASAFIVSLQTHTSITQAFRIPVNGILAVAFYCLFTGATGEESGWRGFLLVGYRQKHTLLTSCIFTGLVWAFWHLPLWLLSGYSGLVLVIYIFAFIVNLIGFSITMMYYYEKCQNIIVPVFFHYMINFVLAFYCGDDILYQVYTAVIYSIVSLFFILRDKKLYLSLGREADNNTFLY